MYLFENPVLQRELLVNLRMKRAFVLLLLYPGLLALVVMAAWPNQDRLSANAEAAKRLVDLFFLGQYILASLMAPSFASGCISGEKERKTYEMLLASPLRPTAIVIGKLMASLLPLAMLISSSLPIVMLCLPLGGVSFYEVLAAYLALGLSVVTFGVISLACSSYFQRTAAALTASYLLILPMAMAGIILWRSLAATGRARLMVTVTLLPLLAIVMVLPLLRMVAHRLLHPPDVGSEGKEVVDLEQEAEQVVGLVIQPDQFPDRLFAPPKRAGLLPDGSNPVFDKEIRSELFSQGTLMLRLVIQVSMFLAIPLMAFCLFIAPYYASWYISYILLFNMLVGPVFLAGAITSERERQTLDLLLTTTISPQQILWGKLLANLRVSTVLTLFLVWPLILACVMISFYWKNWMAVLAYALIILLTCLTTATVGLFCSVVFRKTSVSLITSLMVLAAVFCLPLTVYAMSQSFFAESEVATVSYRLSVVSPFAAALSVPLSIDRYDMADSRMGRRAEAQGGLSIWAVGRSWRLFGGHVAWAVAINGILLGLMQWLFNTRWRVSQ